MAKHEYTRKYQQYTILAEDPDESILHLLTEIKKQTTYGHSFDIITDPMTENEQTFFIDGDGCDKIHAIEFAEVTKTYVYDDEPIRSYMVNMGAEHEQSQN